MAVDLGLFELAAPPATGASWVMGQCDRAGLRSDPTSASSVLDVFSEEKSNKLRVSLVCHPCQWLSNMYQIIKVVNASFIDFSTLYVGEGFVGFVQQYLDNMPGRIGRVFDEYKCDARMKIEDMPWALVELLESMGVPEEMLNRISDPGKLFVEETRSWDERLRREVIEAEQELCLTYDYY